MGTLYDTIKKKAVTPLGKGSLYERVAQRQGRPSQPIISPLSPRPSPFGPISLGIQTTTPAFVETGTIEQVGVLGREVGQSISRNVASFLGSEALASTIDPILKKVGEIERNSPFFARFTEDLGKRLYGDVTEQESIEITGETRAEQIAPVGERVVKMEERLERKKKEYDDLLANPDIELSARERQTLETLSAVIGEQKTNLAPFIIGSLVGLDIYPGFGSADDFFKAVVRAKSRGEAISLLRKVNVADDLIEQFADDVVKVSTRKDAEKLFESITELQRTTKATIPIPEGLPKITPRVVDEISSNLQPLAQEARKPFSVEEQARYNSYTHYPKDFNREYANIVSPYKQKVESNFGNNVPEELQTLLDEHSKRTEQYLRAEGERMLNAPSPYVVGPANYNVSRTRKANSAFEKKAEEFNEFERKLESKINQLAKAKNQAEFSALSETDQLKENIASAERQIAKMNPTRDEYFIEKMTKQKVSLERKLKKLEEVPKSQLTDFYNRVVREAKPTARQRLVTQAQKPPFQYKQLDDLAEKIKQKDITERKFEEIQLDISFAEERIEDMPGKKLVRFISRKEGEFLDFKSLSLAKTESERRAIIARNQKVMEASEIAFQGTEFSNRFDDPDVIRQAIDDYTRVRDRLVELKEIAKDLRLGISAVRKGERLMVLAKGDRRMAYRAVRNAFDLSESELVKLRQGRDIMAMEKSEFDRFIGEAERMAEQIQKTREARIQLEGTIREKELRKWENVQEVMGLPPISKMTPEQLTQLDEVLSQYKTADEFLTVRQLQTIDRTKLAGIRTTREVTEFLASKYGLKVDEFPPIKAHPFMYDAQLARQHPLFDLLVNRYNESYLRANGRIIELERTVDDLIKQARKSRPVKVAEKIAPTDKKIAEWLESTPDQRKLLEAEMTSTELKAAQKMDEVFKEYYDYLVQRSLDRKFSSRFEDKYFPHVRRGFLEAWKEDGFMKAVKEQFDQFKQEERLLTILDEKTGDVLPYEKWIGFSQFRTGGLVPTQNASRAFKTYITALEKARQWDEFIPEIMTYVHSLSPRQMTQRGLELDDSVKRFVKSWINSKKGRIEKQIIKPGGKVDWALRMGVALTRIRDLGLNIPIGIANIFGEQAGNLTMLGAKNYALGVSRLATSKGREVTRRYANFVGKSLWEKLTEASNTAGDQFLGGVFGLFSAASRRGNQIFLLGNLTKAEWEAGEIALTRLAELRKRMGKYRVVEGAESIFGKSVEGAIGGQYKKWAIPILVSTKDNATKLVSILRTKGVKEALSSKEGAELFYSTVLGSVVGLGVMGYYRNLEEKKDRNFAEDLLYKSMRDALSMIGALNPKFIGSFATPRLASFIVDLTEAIDQVLFFEKTKEGELKGVTGLERTLTPVLIKSLFKEEEKTKPKTKQIPTPSGLPSLPGLQGLPTPVGLPKLP